MMFSKSNTMNKGITVIELLFDIMMIAIVVLAIFFALMQANVARGAELRYMPEKNSSVAWESALIQLKENSDLDLVVFAYADVWSYEDKEGAGKVDKAIDAVNSVIDSFVQAGIDKSRLIFGMANKGGMTVEEESHITGDGIYLQLK